MKVISYVIGDQSASIRVRTTGGYTYTFHNIELPPNGIRHIEKLKKFGKTLEIYEYLKDVLIGLTSGELTSGELTSGGSNPEQYGLPDNALELQDLIEYRKMNFAIGNIFKSCYRMGHCSHSDQKRDLRKIIWFAERELKRLEND